jgi:hypothetical protein
MPCTKALFQKTEQGRTVTCRDEATGHKEVHIGGSRRWRNNNPGNTRGATGAIGRARINLFYKLLLLCSVAVVTFCGPVCGGGPDTGTKGQPSSPQAETYRFMTDAYSKQNLRPFVDIVWDHITSQLKTDRVESPTISKEDVALIMVDLNDDGRKDIIAVIAGNMLFCGKFGRECSLIIFVSTDTGFRKVECCMNVGWEEHSVYILREKNHGLRNMLLNGVFVMKFDGTQFCDQ